MGTDQITQLKSQLSTGTMDVKSGTSEHPKDKLDLAFPETALIGSLGELARLLAHGTEVSPEFYFVSALTIVGAIASGRLGLNINMDVDPRLYTALVGQSYTGKKSTAQRRTIGFFQSLPPLPNEQGDAASALTPGETSLLDSAGVRISFGVGSAEGLASLLKRSNRVFLGYDELKALIDKAGTQSSVLLPMVTSLFEGTTWSNTTKKTDFLIKDARLSILGCCTLQTYDSMWTREAIAIGFENRLLLVSADRKNKVAWPQPVEGHESLLKTVGDRIHKQLAKLPLDGSSLRFEITADALEIWEHWYDVLPDSPHARRLDTIGFRLLALLTLTTDKEIVDAEVVDAVVKILDYELQLRRLIDPIDAENSIARVEQKIVRALQAYGALSKRDLRRKVHADREGDWVFTKAVSSLQTSERIIKTAAGVGKKVKFQLRMDEE